jgi:hypothetical protein
MRKRLVLVGGAILAALAIAAPTYAAFPEPVLAQADMDVLTHGRKPTWKLDYLLCYTGSGVVQVEISEFQYLQGAKTRTLQVQTRGTKRLQDPSERGAGGSCSWYHSLTYKSRFAQRPGYVNGVTLQLFEAGKRTDRTITRTFRLHP